MDCLNARLERRFDEEADIQEWIRITAFNTANIDRLVGILDVSGGCISDQVL